MVGPSTDDSVFMRGQSRIEIGRYSYGLDEDRILQWNEGAPLKIGRFCSIAHGVTFFLGGNHRSDWATTYPFGHIFVDALGGTDIKGHPATNGGISIGNDVWIGDGAAIMSGVTIGDGAVIAARAHVVKDVGPYEIVGGNPARMLRHRFSDEIKAQLLALRWWDLETAQIRAIAPSLSTAPSAEMLAGLIATYRPMTEPPAAPTMTIGQRVMKTLKMGEW